jgi:hypothetical protein
MHPLLGGIAISLVMALFFVALIMSRSDFFAKPPDE